jgi:hypothetical protein
MKAVRFLALSVLLAGASQADAQQYFGQNQVQYKHFKWRVLETEHFLVHYYPEEKAAVSAAARMAERSYARLSKVLGHQFREKKPIILFSSRADFGQNNVTGDLGEGVGGVTESGRHRLILPFTGDLGSFEHVLAHEMVHEFQYDVFARGKAGAGQANLERVNPPLWFMEGMAEYLSIGPSHPLTAGWLRDAAVAGNIPTAPTNISHIVSANRSGSMSASAGAMRRSARFCAILPLLASSERFSASSACRLPTSAPPGEKQFSHSTSLPLRPIRGHRLSLRHF